MLAELLLDRNNFQVMMKFISSKQNLKMMMNLLIDKSKNIQFEAFHVFKVFVANPRKPDTIVNTLVKNKERLVTYLDKFHIEKQDAQFVDEKKLIIQTIQDLKAVEPETPAAASTASAAASTASAAASAAAAPPGSTSSVPNSL